MARSPNLLSAKKSNLLCCGIIDLEACKPCRPTAACIIAGRRGQNTARCRSFVNAAFSFLEKTLCGDLSYKLLCPLTRISVFVSVCSFMRVEVLFLTVRYTVPVSNVAATIGLYYCDLINWPIPQEQRSSRERQTAATTNDWDTA